MPKDNYADCRVNRVPHPQTKARLSSEIGKCIYFVRLPDGLIKIGYTSDLTQRLHKFGGFKALLAVKPGTLADEQALHATLTAHVARGKEYYHPTPEIMALVNEVRTALHMAPVAA